MTDPADTLSHRHRVAMDALGNDRVLEAGDDQYTRIATVDTGTLTMHAPFDSYSGMLGEMHAMFNRPGRLGGPIDFDIFVGTSVAEKNLVANQHDYEVRLESCLFDLYPSPGVAATTAGALAIYIREKPRAVIAQLVLASSKKTLLRAVTTTMAAAGAAASVPNGDDFAADNDGDDSASDNELSADAAANKKALKIFK
jgi:hypothetical protein